jgi:tRNA A37 threonylcarbamoyladenosine modification protein TsaB
MGWLGIDTRVNGHSALSWIEGSQIETVQVEGKAARALPVLARLTKDRAEKIEGILVASGPGTFSSVRTGVLYANIYARLLKIPLLELSEEEALPGRYVQAIEDYRAGKRPASEYVAPIYDREPNITLPRPTT